MEKLKMKHIKTHPCLIERDKLPLTEKYKMNYLL